MLEALIGVAIIVLMLVGFWWTRGAGVGAKSVGSPGSEEVFKFARGKHVPDADDQIEGEREHDA
jgi:hypothetical protein